MMGSFSYLLLLKCGCSAHADNRGPSRSRGRSPIWPGTGTLPRHGPRPRFVRNRGLSPVPVPDLAGTGTLPRPRFPSGGPRPDRAVLRKPDSVSATRPGLRLDAPPRRALLAACDSLLRCRGNPGKGGTRRAGPTSEQTRMARSGQASFTTRPKSRTMRAKRK
jgi:hypothetical protein